MGVQLCNAGVLVENQKQTDRREVSTESTIRPVGLQGTGPRSSRWFVCASVCLIVSILFLKVRHVSFALPPQSDNQRTNLNGVLSVPCVVSLHWFQIDDDLRLCHDNTRDRGNTPYFRFLVSESARGY